MSHGARWLIVAFILVFAWMLLAGWATDTPKQRAIEVALVCFMLLLALGAAVPTRFVLALRVVAGIVAVGYGAYFVAEVVQLLRGERQPVLVGQPSATMAGLGVLFYGVPALVFALGAERVGLGRLFRSRSEAAPLSDPSDDVHDLDQHSNER